MTEFVKCDLCEIEICEPEKCTFAVVKRVINGRQYYFCCEAHAREFEKEKKKKK
jgi:YHS domain-containing protein